MSIHYLREKAYSAQRALAFVDGPLAVRLGHTYMFHLMQGIHDAEEGGYLDENLLEDLHALAADLTAVEAVGDEGSVMATMNALPTDRIKELAAQLWDLCSSILAQSED